MKTTARQYDDFGNIILTDEEKKSMIKLILKNEYFCPTLAQYKALVRRHRDGDEVEKAKVIYVLTACNFHAECGLLAEGKYKEAMNAY